MTQMKEIYKCEVCGNIVEVVQTGIGTLVCCGKPMVKMVENTVDASVEKHMPVLEKAEHGTIIKIGSVPHPMEDEHYIEWIQAFNRDGKAVRIVLKPGEKPEAHIGWKVEDLVEVRAYCNKHGLWSKK